MQDFCFARKVFGEDFLYEKHVNYLLKSLKKSTSGTQLDVAEAHRLSSLFFVISGLDLLGALDTRLTKADREEIIEWIYSYQVDVNRVKFPDQLISDNPSSPKYATETKTIPKSNNQDATEIIKVGCSGFRATSMMNNDIPLDSGTLSMTYCALATLVILNDDLRRVDRKSIIAGMRQLQLPDGSFTPSVYGGENDMRIVYCAVAVSRLLDDWSGIDKDKCAKFIKRSLSYEGAFAQCPGAEAHGGSTFCALASLKLMSKLDDTLSKEEVDRLIRWCINRIDYGFAGRPNKDQDTCYSFWIGACLVMLDHFKYIEQKNLVEFILQAQEERGGLSKVPAFYSDPLHTYLGFAGLTFVDDELCLMRRIKLLKLDPTLNISQRARNYLDKLHDRWRRASLTINTNNEIPVAPTTNKSSGLNEKNNGESHKEPL